MQRENRVDHIALYGNVRILRSYCKQCDTYAFVLENKRACCGAPYEAVPVRYRRMSEPEQRRRVPSAQEKEQILNAQDYRCAYCGQTFGSIVTLRGRDRRLEIRWDHAVPFSYAQNNNTDNFVAACHVCNTWKSDRLFQSFDEARTFLAQMWSARGITVSG